MKLLVSFVITFSSAACFAQTDFGVWAEISPNITTHYVHSNYDTSRCGLSFLNLRSGRAKRYFIISDSSCKQYKPLCYVALIDSTVGLIEKFNFVNQKSIDSALAVAKLSSPNIQDRITQGKIILKAYKEQKLKDEIQEEKNRLIEEIREQKELEQKTEKAAIILRENNIVLNEWSWYYSNEYSLAFDLSFSIINPYKKKIKYVWLTFQAFNPVGDLAHDRVTGSSTKTVQGIGPIDYLKIGSYEFESIFYSKVVESVKVKSLKLQFFDGTIKTFLNPLSLEDYK